MARAADKLTSPEPDGEAPRFLLLDPSIAGGGGHYLEYAGRVLRAAVARGYRPLLATNRSFRPAATDLDCPVHPVFTYDIWGLRSPPEPDPAERVRADARRLKLAYSRLGWLWEAAELAPRVAQYAALGGLPRPLARRLDKAVAVRARYDALERAADPSALGKADLSESELFEAGLARVRAALRGVASGEPLATPPPAPLEAVLRASDVADDFRSTLLELLDQLRLGAEDHVFMPDVGWHDLAGLAQALRRRRGAVLPSFHGVFRRNVFDGYPEQYGRMGYSVHELRMLFSRLESDGGGRARCYTDTVALADQYAAVGARTRVLPVPSPRFPPRPPVEPGPLRVGFFGDARREKGFHWLREVLTRLRGRGALPRFRFRFQAYLPRIGADMETLRALEGMRCDLTLPLTLIEGQLDSAAYQAEFTQLDAVLVPYERAPYIARSSGIFAEAGAAGLPAIVPAGTWMAGVLDGRTAAYHARSIPPGRVVASSVEPAASDWRIMTPQGEFDFVPPGADLPIAANARPYTMIRRPNQATHLWVRFRREASARGLYVMTTLAPRDAQFRAIWERPFVVGGSEAEVFSLLVRLPDEARDVWMAFEPAYTAAAAMSLHDLTVAWVRLDEDVARCAGGLTYDPNRPVDELTHALLELERDAEALGACARSLQADFAAEHSAERLVDIVVSGAIEADAANPPAMRLSRW